MGFKPAPKASSGEAIDLKPLLGKAVAVRVNNTREVETKFGTRPLAEVTMLVEGSAEPLDGVLFQSYFTELAQGEWFAGIVAKMQTGDFERWALDYSKLTKKQAAALEKLIAEQPLGVPF